MSERPSVYAMTVAASTLLAKGEGGFDTDEEMAAWLGEVEAWALASGSKFDACRAVIARASADAKFLRDEATRLQDHATRMDGTAQKVEMLAERLLRAHRDVTGEAKLTLADGGWVKLAERTSESVEVTDADALPYDCTRTKVEPDKTAIKAKLKAGEAVPGAQLVKTVRESLSWSK